MSATVHIAERNGPLATSVETVDPTNVNFGSADVVNLNPATYPLTAGAGACSYEKWLRLYVSSMGGSVLIDNLKVWLSDLGGGYKTGESMLTSLVTSGYSAPSYPSGGPSGSVSSVAVNAMPTSMPSGANLGIGGILAGQILVAPAYSDYMVFQLELSASTPSGTLNTKTFTYQWDEQ